MNNDKSISRVLFIISALIILYWLFSGCIWVWDWYQDSGGYTAEWWGDVGRFLWNNLSIVIAVYTLICLQAAGLAELRHNKSFMRAFGLALALTPPVMMIAYGRRQ